MYAFLFREHDLDANKHSHNLVLLYKFQVQLIFAFYIAIISLLT